MSSMLYREQKSATQEPTIAVFNQMQMTVTDAQFKCPMYSRWPKVCHNAMTMPESREAHRK